MSQLTSLTEFLIATMPKRAMQRFDSQMDEITFIPAQRDTGLGQYRIAVIRYNAVLTWEERYSYREHDPKILMTLLMAWLSEDAHGLFEETGLDSELPEFDIDIIDQDTAIVVVTLPLAEALNQVPDKGGPIPFDGQRQRLADPDIWQADEVTVIPPQRERHDPRGAEQRIVTAIARGIEAPGATGAKTAPAVMANSKIRRGSGSQTQRA